MKKAFFNLPVMMAAAFSLAATGVVTALVFFGQPIKNDAPTRLLDEAMVVPDFEVTDHTGKTFTRQDMLGKVWVCDFFLTRCNGVCPILGLTMSDLAEDLSKDEAFDGVRLVSFSVDPEYDTLEQLRQYRRTNLGVWARGSDERRAEIEQRWVHARAEDQEAFWTLVREGFKLGVGPASPEDQSTPISHSGRLVLIDRQGNIRGYYDGLTDEHMPALLADIRRLVDEE